jgi:hypothetical protein
VKWFGLVPIITATIQGAMLMGKIKRSSQTVEASLREALEHLKCYLVEAQALNGSRFRGNFGGSERRPFERVVARSEAIAEPSPRTLRRVPPFASGRIIVDNKDYHQLSLYS